MNAKQYSKSKYNGFPTYQKIAEEAFKAGLESAKPKDIKVLEQQLKEVKEELKSLWRTLEDPEECGRLLAGM